MTDQQTQTPPAAETPAEASPRIPDDLAREIFEARALIRERQQRLDNAHDAVRAAKGLLAEAEDDFYRLIDDVERGGGPLFAPQT